MRLFEHVLRVKTALMKNPRYLTKTRMKLGLECPKKLFYYGKEEFETLNTGNEFLEALAEGGFQVEELARFHYKYKFIDYEFYLIETLDYEESIKQTKEALKKDKVIICEAAILFDNFFIRADILVKNGDKIKLIEIKSKSTSSGDSNELLTKKIPSSILSTERPYVADIAFQHYVIQSALSDFSVTPYLTLVNKNTPANIDGLNQLFKIKTKEINGKTRAIVETDIERIENLQEEIKDTVLQEINMTKIVDNILDDSVLRKMSFEDELNKPLLKFNTNNNLNFIQSAHFLAELYKSDTPFAKNGEYLGSHCDACEFRSDYPEKSGYFQCWNERYDNFDDLKHHIFEVWFFPKKKSGELLENGIWSIEELHKNPSLNPIKKNDDPMSRSFRQYMQIEKSALNDSTEWISNELFNIMDEWTYPYHFIDFETCTVALPFHKGEFPYSMIASQFSIHTLYEDGTIEHSEYLAEDSDIDPSIQFVSYLMSHLENDNGSIFRYASHENTTLKHIYNRIPLSQQKYYKDEMDFISSITIFDKENPPERAMVDLKWLVEKHYYNPHTLGSNSLKYVLPAIMKSSPVLKDKYSSPLNYGTNLKDYIFYQEIGNELVDPYSMLPSLSDIVGAELIDAIFKKDSLADGGAAMKAFQVLQFSDISIEEKNALRTALLNYCELDTLAMVMLFEHLKYLSIKDFL